MSELRCRVAGAFFQKWPSFARALVILAVTAGAGTPAWAADVNPKDLAVDTSLALRNPDEYAWRVFMQINWPAKKGVRGEPEPSAKLGDAGDVVWETWKLSSGGPEGSEVFKRSGKAPDPWPQAQGPLTTQFRFEPDLQQQLVRKAITRKPSAGAMPMFDPSVVTRAVEVGAEVRMNRATFDYVVANTLYNVEGLEAAFKKAVAERNPKLIEFPPEAKEIKAMWTKITEADKPRYHWAEYRVPAESGGGIEIWGLTALHVVTRELPNWFWATFQHVDSEAATDEPSRDSTTEDTNGVRKELIGTKWQFYRLRGSQIDFTNSEGNPVILANSEIERGFQNSSSCMSCHARATVAPRADPTKAGYVRSLPMFVSTAPIRGAIGVPDSNWFFDQTGGDGLFGRQGRRLFLQTSFVWSLAFRARSTVEPPPTTPALK